MTITLLLIPLIVLLVLAVIFSVAQKFLMRWVLKTEMPWSPIFKITLLMGTAYTVTTMALVSVVPVPPLIVAPLGVIVHALLVAKFVPDSTGGQVRFWKAIVGQALTVLMFSVQLGPFYYNMLGGLS